MWIFNKQTKQKTTQQSEVELIDQIHNEFYSEVNILLNKAKQFNEIKNKKPELVDKRNRLYNLGFRNTPEMIEADEEIERLNQLDKDNKNKSDLIEAINYFSLNYPEYKFITEESVVNICNKYGLVYSTIDNFRGNVPFENLEQIEKFKIKDKDWCYYETYTSAINWNESFNGILSFEQYNNKINGTYYPTFGKYKYYKNSLEICAPLNQFDITDLELQGKKLVKKQIEIKDPIVLCPVFFKGFKHYLIVTAWGIESHDSEVINQKLN